MSNNESNDVAPDEAASQASGRESQTAQDFITSQLRLEADAREALPYQFDTCTRPFGALRQNLFSCLTCNPPPSDPSQLYTPAGVCYSCSISCHGEHELVELFSRRSFVCDCGTKRLPASSPCSLQMNPKTGLKGGVHSEEPAADNRYNHNFRNRFCGCGELYDPSKEKGTMFQCLGLGNVKDGGCGEDWWHPECIVGLGRNWDINTTDEQGEGNKKFGANEYNLEKLDSHNAEPSRHLGSPHGNRVCEDDDPPLPPGFPAEDDFEHMICYKCVNAFPWIRKYAGIPGILSNQRRRQPLKVDNAAELSSGAGTRELTNGASHETVEAASRDADKKRKVDAITENSYMEPTLKKSKSEGGDEHGKNTVPHEIPCKFRVLPSQEEQDTSLFLPSDFREHLCRCPECFPALSEHRQLLEEEESYSPPISETSSAAANGDGSQSVGSRSILDRGEEALNNMDRVRAIEGVMAYNHLRDKVKNFLKPFADSGQAVGAEDVKKYFEKLRGDEEAIRAAGGVTQRAGDGDDGDNRREQRGH